jgi:hypothetical protein
MRIPQFVSVVSVALLFVPALGTAGDAAKPLTVELRSFTFKVPKGGKEELLQYQEGEDKLAFYINGTSEAKVDVPTDGDYQIAIKASCDMALKVGANFKVAMDGKAIGNEKETSDEGPREYTVTAPLKAGQHKLAIEFTNDAFKEGEYDRNLYVHAVALKKLK